VRSWAHAFAVLLLVLCSAARGERAPRLVSFRFPDQRGKLVSRGDLTGHVWVADFMYTTCRGACPLVTSRLVALQQRLPDPELRFVSFSVDPDADTPKRLQEYAARWHASESRWHLLATDHAGLSALISSLNLELTRDRGELLHSERFYLIDSSGLLFGDYDSSDDRALAHLVDDVAALTQRAPASQANGSGSELFRSLGCAGCHADAQLAPPLADLLGAQVMFERGPALEVDEAYLRESIATPSAKIVAGYAPTMPAYGSLLSDHQLDSLVEYVRSLRREPAMTPLLGATGAQAASPERDPVCGMITRVTAETPEAIYHDRTYHFCSAACAARFRAGPEKYLP